VNVVLTPLQRSDDFGEVESRSDKQGVRGCAAGVIHHYRISSLEDTLSASLTISMSELDQVNKGVDGYAAAVHRRETRSLNEQGVYKV
jgi:hypothetical protein